MFRKLTLFFVALLVVVLRADTAVAIDQAACCLPTTSRLDSLMNPAQGGDEKFFSRTSGPPNILFIIDTSSSMHAWPTTWPADKGCSHTFFDSLGYNKDEQYPRLWTGLNAQSDDWFASAKYYDAPSSGYGYDFGGTPSGSSWTTVTDACKGVSNSNSDKTLCQQCLDTKGYYVQSNSTRRVKGNFLNFYAPRDSGAVKVLADVIRDLKEVRFGVMAYQTANAQGCWGKKSNSTIGAQCLCISQPFGPTCDKSYPLDNSSVENNRNSVLNTLTNHGGNGNGLAWDACNTPLSDALYAAGFYFQSKTSPTPFTTYFGSSAPKPSNNNAYNNSDGICFECGFNAIILLTDGEPYDEGKVITLPSGITNDTTECVGCNTTSSLHKVAKFLWEHDLRADKDGTQSVATYTIGFSEDVTSSRLLSETARLGGGKFFPARSTSELKQAILKILDNINARNTAFSSAALNSMQSQSTSQMAVIPRMMPARNKGWSGKLFRFEQFNEFVLDQDKNGDKDKDDVYLVDKDGSVVAENKDGEFRKVTAFSTPTSETAFGGVANEYWEASAKLLALGHLSRTIYTVTDNGRTKGGNKDGLINQDDALVEVKLANLDELKQYLSVSGAPLCPSGSGTTYLPGLILDKMGVTVTKAAEMMNTVQAGVVATTPTTQSDFDRLCAALIIQYVRGQDLFDEDGDGIRSATRPSVLGDIFHSSPAVVTPPVDKFLCDLGISTQCVRTLYANTEQLGVPATPLDSATYPASCKSGSGTKTGDAYDGYHYRQRLRERLILVGANDGMLHAFSDGTGEEDASCNVQYKPGSGAEKWAFIPSDLLPRLQDMLQGHAYYVDGDVMIRDIWVDENGDGKKSESEYHTVAVVAEGRGGTHYFALDLRWDTASKPAAQAPGFRWMFPQPCTDEALRFGKTLFSLSPKSPPIGPILMASTTGLERHPGNPSAERWVTMLSGGWSPGGEKGRGIYMVDVWNGKVDGRRDNLLWKWEYSPAGKTTGDGDKPREFLKYGIVAPVAMVDYGANNQPRMDGFFDTAMVGDLGGQLWTLRFFEPGVIGSTGLVSNWSGARAFSMDRQDVASSADENINKRSPIFYLSSVALQSDTKALRAFVGTGNRYSLLDEGVGTCRFDNLQACSKLGCDSTSVSYKVTRGTSDYQVMANTWGDNGLYKGTQYTPWADTPSSFNYCGSQGSTSFIKATFDKRETLYCPNASNGSTTNYDFARTSVECGQYALNVFDCRVKDPSNTLYMSDLAVKQPASSSTTVGKNRFFGIWAYGGAESRTFDENPGKVSSNLAAQFDNRRLTDTGGTGGTGDLINVTDVTCKADGVCSCVSGSSTCKSTKPVATSNGYGWFYEYDGMEHKTASGSAVLASCTMWNSMYSVPVSSGPNKGSAACSGSYTSKARLFQADFVTGAPSCAAGFSDKTVFARYQEREVLAPPPDVATSIQVSKTGQVKYSTVFVEPGPNREKASQTQVSANSDVLQYIYELPVSRNLHACRHDQADGKQSCIPSEM
ncbi:pilus assembly protein [Vitiosangium sp. GDMCC 1.1324]|uniref:pilus assembly protein n=1 Tax=Vitiosangium sp. (strain GDMCC 1.1324) TaxID=2138576 RepID=UPI000D398C39|nr:PilC/PilY family type IV pilus protein [Vitiosangium sp. GDMCC 1.1324]PTL77650.1 pilus assembly protein PilY [Vitiosangium sp. GDMCC 1.1324]